MSKRKSQKKSDEPVGCSAYLLLFAFALFCLNYFWHWLSGEWSSKLTIFTVIGVILAVLFLWGESGESENKKKTSPTQDENVFNLTSVNPEDAEE